MSGPRPDESQGSREDVLPERLRAHLERDFAIEGEVGRGGMATVWRATRRRDQAVVAIKVLRPVLAEAVGARRFLREIQIAANSRSDFLMPLEESGQFDGLPYYVMPFINGSSLRQRMVRERQLPVGDVVRIGRDIATALSVLHRDGIIHRDVKPENVLLRDGHDVLVADYGIARAAEGVAPEELTSTGIVLGTPAYMSPEQAGGNQVDARTDQYSWGCLIYEMLLGVTPFHGATSQAVIARHMHDTVPSLRVVRRAIPDSLEAVIHRAMGKVPADRFPTFDALIEALDKVDLTHLESTTRRARAWRRVAAVAAGAVVLAGGAAAVRYGWQLTHPPLDPNRVALFPLVAADSSWQSEAARVSTLVRSVLEDIEPQRWIDGASLLAVGEVATQLDERRKRALTRAAGARYYVASTVQHRTGTRAGSPDSIRVAVTLHDLEEDLDTTAVAVGAAAALPDVAMSAVVGLLPRLTGLEDQINPASVFGRAPVAVSNWLRGEREYRESRIHSALDYLRRAIAADSSLAPAAIRGAMAAMWIPDERESSQLVALAQRHRAMLSSSQAAFAEALRLYLIGAADSAVVAVRQALAADSVRAEPWMLASEIFLHLQPSVPLDSELVREVPPQVHWPLERWSEDYRRRARLADPGFTAPLAHLAQSAARRADIAAMDSLTGELQRVRADSGPLSVLTLARRCLTSRMTAADWASVTSTDPNTTFEAGVILSGASAPRARACTDAAWSGLLAADSDPGRQFAAIVARFSLLVSAGSDSAALALVDSAVASGMNSALGLYVLGAAAGVDPGRRVDAFITQLDAALESRPAPSLWLLTLWSSRTDDTARLSRVRARLETLKSTNGTRLDTLISDVVAAWYALARHDTTAALKAFGALSPRAPASVLQGSLWETLAPERLAYARLLLATGSPALAHRIASVFDQPGLYLNLLYLRPSLDIRMQAARALGDGGLRRAAEGRLRRPSPDAR